MNSGAGGFDSHALPPSALALGVTLRTLAETEIRPIAQGDEAQLLRSFSEVFGAVDPNYQPLRMGQDYNSDDEKEEEKDTTKYVRI